MEYEDVPVEVVSEVIHLSLGVTQVPFTFTEYWSTFYESE